MKLSLVVAAGVHQGKVIPVPGTKFLIGRDPECQLRPASQAVSKQHCALLVRDGKVFVQDFGSTNGTFVNGEQLAANAEREVKSGDRLKIGPLDFTVDFTPGKPSDSTPLPNALQSVTPGSGKTAAVGAKKPASSGTQKPAAAEPPKPQPIPRAPSLADDAEGDAAAALLLGLGDEPPGTEPKVPGGSTVMELNSVNAAEGGEKPEEKKDDKKTAAQSKEDSSNAASEILRKYMRRPR